MHYTLVITSLFLTLCLAQETRLQLGRFAKLCKHVITSSIVDLYKPQ